MNYFTREELEDITSELLANPTRETLKNLNEKYNGNTESVEEMVKEMPSINVEPPVVETIEAPRVATPIPTPVVEAGPVVQEIPAPVVEEQPVVSPIPNFNVPNMEIPKVENIMNASANVTEMPSFELPKLETPAFNNQNNEPVNFSGNLWEVPAPEMNNLMQTTDNFSAIPNAMPTTEVPVTPAPFFGPYQEQVNNPIPVNNAPVQGPTMFGQMQQNFM